MQAYMTFMYRKTSTFIPVGLLYSTSLSVNIGSILKHVSTFICETVTNNTDT
jgi:hypothetical protein